MFKTFADLDADRIVVTTRPVNTAPQRVMEKAGLSLVRTFFERWPECLEAAEHGDVEYVITRQAWTNRSDHEQSAIKPAHMS